jgi:tetratricopeptide (TPR) repeat protein
VPLTDPELDLLRELLEDDPSAELYLDVGRELVRRGMWSDAMSTLAAGVRQNKGSEGHALLARAALEMGEYDISLASLDAINTDPSTAPENASLRILATERRGDLNKAKELALAFLVVAPNDVVASAVIERLDAPPPAQNGRGLDPFITVERAERFVVVGRVDRAIRVYRRLLFHNPEDRGIELRLRQLSAEDSEPALDDLSEELTDPGLVPPEFTMPSPGLGATLPANHPPDTDGGESETETDEPRTSPTTPSVPPGRRRRRSLIRR